MSSWLETNRGTVHPWETDSFGHMNIRFYMAAFADAAWHLAHAMGMSPSYMRAEGRGIATVRTDLRYKRELLEGDIWHIRSGFTRVGNSSFHFIQEMYNSETVLLASTYNGIAVHLDLDIRKGVPIPKELREAAHGYMVEFSDESEGQ